ncbi:hypothetical protein [Xenorhabdus lircayensis]
MLSLNCHEAVYPRTYGEHLKLFDDGLVIRGLSPYLRGTLFNN